MPRRRSGWPTIRRYGLGASIFSRDKRRRQGLAEKIESGAVCINDSLVNFIIPDAPMGGRKDSGFGYRHGAEGIRKFCQQKTIVIDRFGLKEEFPWYPATAEKSPSRCATCSTCFATPVGPHKLRAFERAHAQLTGLHSCGDSSK